MEHNNGRHSSEHVSVFHVDNEVAFQFHIQTEWGHYLCRYFCQYFYRDSQEKNLFKCGRIQKDLRMGIRFSSDHSQREMRKCGLPMSAFYFVRIATSVATFTNFGKTHPPGKGKKGKEKSHKKRWICKQSVDTSMIHEELCPESANSMPLISRFSIRSLLAIFFFFSNLMLFYTFFSHCLHW